MRLFVSTALAVLCLAAPALAGDVAAKPAVRPENQVDTPILVAPMALDGKLVAYAYLKPALLAASDSAKSLITEKIPFLQDAFLRDVNAASTIRPNTPDQFDTAAVAARLYADAQRILGAASVKGLIFTQVQISLLRPGASAPEETAATSADAAPAPAGNPTAKP